MSEHEVSLYMDHAHEMLEAAAHNIAGGFYGSGVNRAYYAVFYAANALLLTRGITRSKHSGVIAAFRQHLIKPGRIEGEYGEIYGRVMDDRHLCDYDVESFIEPERAQADLYDAQRFVERMARYLNEEPGYEQATFSSTDSK